MDWVESIYRSGAERRDVLPVWLTDAGVPRGVGLEWERILCYQTKDHHLALTPLPAVVNPARALAHNPDH